MENQKEKEFSYVSVKLLEEVGLLPALLLQNIIALNCCRSGRLS